jgi:nucleoside-diphosphate-sugar epimerase
MTILVTGAAGRVGNHVVRQLRERGDAVRAFVLPSDAGIPGLAALGAEVVEGRLEDRADVTGAVRGADAVVHLGAALTSRGGTDDEFFAVNLGGTFNVLMAVRDEAPDARRVVFASSEAVYLESHAIAPERLPIDEEHPRRPGLIYGAAKLAGEELCLTFWRAYGIPITIARFSGMAEPWEWVDPTSVYGRRMFVGAAVEALTAMPAFHSLGRRSERHERRLATLRAIDDGAPQLFAVVGSDGWSPTFSMLDARDAAAGVLRLMDVPGAVGEAFNLGGPRYVEAELISFVASRLGLPFHAVPLDPPQPSWYLDGSKASRLLGFEPTRTVYEMIEEALA